MSAARSGVHRQYGFETENGSGRETGDASVGAGDGGRQWLQGENRRVDGDKRHESETKVEQSEPAKGVEQRE